MDPLQLQSAVSSLLAEVNAVNAPPPLNPIDINQGVHGGPAIKVHEKIARALKPHQVEGVRFLWNAVCAQDNQDVSGCILAHAMGLGKTLQTIALVHALMIASKDSPSLLPLNMRVGECAVSALHFPTINVYSLPVLQSQHLRVLIMCPVTVIDNWMQEFHQWIPPKTDSYFHLPTSTVYELKAVGPQRKSIIERWSKSGGVLLIGMEMYRDAVAAVETANGDDYRACLLDPHLMVVDEAHRLKNAKVFS